MRCQFTRRAQAGWGLGARQKRRLKIAREVIGDDDVLMLDANQVILSCIQVCDWSLRGVIIDMVCSGCGGIPLSSRAIQTVVHRGPNLT